MGEPELPSEGSSSKNNGCSSHSSTPVSNQNYGRGTQANAASGANQYNNFANGNQYFGIQPPETDQELCLQSLGFEQMEDRHKEIDTATEGTCEWLLQHETYKAWTASGRGLLWIRGKPGSGKSTLLKYALKKASNTNKNNTMILSFFFHGRGDELQKTPCGLFRSLLYQLFREVPYALPDLLDTFKRECKDRGKPGTEWKWHVNELQDFFQSSLPAVLKSRPVCLFVDALDECGKDNAIKLVKTFESWFQKLPPDDDSQFRVFFTCRHHPIETFDYGSKICIEKENTEDILTYVHSKLPKIPGPVRDMIVKHASGVFLWARLVVTRIIDLELDEPVDWEAVHWTKAGWEKVEEKIGRIPDELVDIYKQLVESMKERSTSLKLSQWICFAKRPLSLDELRWAMIVDAELDSPHKSLKESEDASSFPRCHEKMEKRVKKLSCGLVEVVPSSNYWVVQFIHQSVKDFFVEEGLSMLDNDAHLANNSKFAVGIAHYQLSRICIRYFAMKEVTQSTTDDRRLLMSEFPLLDYTIRSWALHVCQSESHEVPQDDLLEYFGWPSENLVQTWARVYPKEIGYYSSVIEGCSLLHIVSQYQMKGPLRAILKRRADQDNFDINARDDRGRTPFMLAAKHGHVAAIQLLLNPGKADVDAKGYINRWDLMGVLSQLLLNTDGVDIDAKDKEDQTPLMHAAKHGHMDVVELLLNTGKVRLDAKDKKGQTPFMHAAKHGHMDVVELLLNTGKVRLDAKDKKGQTPFMHAAKHGHMDVVEILLKTGKVNIDAKNHYRQTPLILAAGSGQELIVELLLKTGKVDVDAKDWHDQTPLIHAARYNYRGVAEILLKIDKVDINAKDDEGKTSLIHAADRGHEAMVDLLLETGKIDNIDAHDKWGIPASYYAFYKGHKAVLEMLLRAGASEYYDKASCYGQIELQQLDIPDFIF